MGKSQRDKGYRGEHEAHKIAEAAGCDVKRNFMSGMYDDIGADLVIDGLYVSVKLRKDMLKWAYDELDKGNDYILARADRKYWLKIKKWKPYFIFPRYRSFVS